jgi:hypothetical protein
VRRVRGSTAHTAHARSARFPGRIKGVSDAPLKLQPAFGRYAEEAALRRLRAVLGFVEVLPTIDHDMGQYQDDEPIEEGEQAPADRYRHLAGGALRRYPTRWRWFG